MMESDCTMMSSTCYNEDTQIYHPLLTLRRVVDTPYIYYCYSSHYVRFSSPHYLRLWHNHHQLYLVVQLLRSWRKKIWVETKSFCTNNSQSSFVLYGVYDSLKNDYKRKSHKLVVWLLPVLEQVRVFVYLLKSNGQIYFWKCNCCCCKKKEVISSTSIKWWWRQLNIVQFHCIVYTQVNIHLTK